jgi:hypothetical protein
MKDEKKLILQSTINITDHCPLITGSGPVLTVVRPVSLDLPPNRGGSRFARVII